MQYVDRRRLTKSRKVRNRDGMHGVGESSNTGAQVPGGDGEKWRLFCEMRDKLKEYSKFTAQCRCISESCFQMQHWNIRLGCRT
jgi:hypothetical protein